MRRFGRRFNFSRLFSQAYRGRFNADSFQNLRAELFWRLREQVRTSPLGCRLHHLQGRISRLLPAMQAQTCGARYLANADTLSNTISL